MQRLKKYKTKEFWEDGSSEVIGYLSIMPGIIMFLVVLVTVIQLGMVNTKLQYVAYAAARAAVTSENYESAVEFAKMAVKRNMATLSTTAIDKDSMEVELTITNGKVNADGTPVDLAGSKSKKKKGKAWKKGNYVNCEVTANVRSPLFGAADTGMVEKSASITMMIERPAEDNLNLLWGDEF